MPEIHATREFAKRHGGAVWLCYFNEHQKGSAKWDHEQHIVQVNRTEALDAAKKGIRDGEVVLPRRGPLIETFAQHLASDAKQLIEDEATTANQESDSEGNGGVEREVIQPWMDRPRPAFPITCAEVP